MIEAPSGISGSAFCTVNRRPFTLMSKIESKRFSVIEPSAAYSATPARDLSEEAIEIAKVRHVALETADVSPDFLHRRRQLRITASRDEDVRAFVHELLRGRKSDAAVATSNEWSLSFKSLSYRQKLWMREKGDVPFWGS